MKKVIIIGSGGIGKTTVTKLIEQGDDVEIISPEESAERGLTITNKEEISKPLTLINPRVDFYDPPLTRAERRKKARKKGKR